MIVLDTDVLIEIFDKKSVVGEDILARIEGYEVATTPINLHEILYGFYKVRKEILRDLLEFKIVDFTRRDALLSAQLEVDLELRGKPTGRFDAMIAATCINRDALLFTLNTAHFDRFIEFGLKLYPAPQ
jgi:predicted nucleic acid-binding protein